MSQHQTFWDKFFRDSKGTVVLWQNPNVPLYTWFICTILTKIVSHGQLRSVVELVDFGAIFTWAWLEISQGVDYFRRAVGMVVMIATIVSRLG